MTPRLSLKRRLKQQTINYVCQSQCNDVECVSDSSQTIEWPPTNSRLSNTTLHFQDHEVDLTGADQLRAERDARTKRRRGSATTAQSKTSLWTTLACSEIVDGRTNCSVCFSNIILSHSSFSNIITHYKIWHSFLYKNITNSESTTDKKCILERAIRLEKRSRAIMKQADLNVSVQISREEAKNRNQELRKLFWNPRVNLRSTFSDHQSFRHLSTVQVVWLIKVRLNTYSSWHKFTKRFLVCLLLIQVYFQLVRSLMTDGHHK